MTGAITTNSTFDGRDVSVDGTKLDGIESLADVTDVTNVTAAGALMDSELTDIASVKALNQGVATTDSPTFAALDVGALVAGRSTYGGTANAITVTTGLSLAALTTGMEIRFRATAANTGATTINVDGLGVATAWTMTGSALPADYVRTDVDTVARYNGTQWVCSREVERGSNANGEYVRWEDGSQSCWDIEDLGAPSTWAGTAGARYKDRTWTYPSAFSVVPYGLCSGDQDQTGPGNLGNINTAVRAQTSNTTTSMKVGAREITTSSTGSVVLSVHAFGKWY
jgi:hypothetical protein